MAEQYNTMEKRLNATIRQLKEEIQTASKKQYEEDCKAMCGNCPGKSVELSQDGELWEHDTNESYGPLQCFATPIHQAWEERTP